MTVARFNEVFARQFNAVNAAPVYKTDSKGRTVRVFTKASPLSREIVRHFYLNVRAVELEEALETIGENGVRYQIEVGHLREDAANKGMLWITKKAAEAYDLPKVRCWNGAHVEHVA